jgi:cell division protein FtsQ
VSLRPREAERALEALPQVGSARVTRIFPGRLRILLEDRRPVAVSLASLEGRLLPVLFDKHGVIFKVGKTADLESLLTDIPVISGLVFENASVGMQLPPMFGAFFAGLEHLHDAAPELLAVLSEIRINRKAYDGFDLILYPSHNPVRVRVSELNEDMLRYMMLVIDVFSSKDIPVEEIDFRTSTASYTVKEASSG